MISQNILNVLNMNSQFKKFVEEIKDFKILTKKLNSEEIKRVYLEYPNLLPKIREDISSIICITLVKNNLDHRNYEKLKKIKFYIDETNENILKILEN